MEFTPIDRGQWPREEYYRHFAEEQPCTFSMVADIDITELRAACKADNIKLFPALVHMITTAVNASETLRTGYDEGGVLGVWEELWPSYTVFHADDNTYSNLWTPYKADFKEFYGNYLSDQRVFGEDKGLEPKPERPANTFTIACVPWVRFRSFDWNLPSNLPDLRPLFTIGRYTSKEDRTLIPLAIQLHHATSDGYHAGYLYNELQRMAARPDESLGLDFP